MTQWIVNPSDEFNVWALPNRKINDRAVQTLSEVRNKIEISPDTFTFSRRLLIANKSLHYIQFANCVRLRSDKRLEQRESFEEWEIIKTRKFWPKTLRHQKVNWIFACKGTLRGDSHKARTAERARANSFSKQSKRIARCLRHSQDEKEKLSRTKPAS